MPKRDDIKSVLVIGSGPIVIGQACEFDYSGTQACRVLRGRGHPGHPGQLQPGDDHDRPGVRRRDLRRADHAGVRREGHRQGAPRRAARRPSAARPRSTRRWRCTSDGVLEKYGVELIGAIHRGDRRAARTASRSRRSSRTLGGEVARSRRSATRWTTASRAADELGYPVVVRPSFTMGGAGSGMAYDEDDLRRIAGAGPGRQPDHRGAPRGVDPRLEGVRARGHARHAPTTW